MKRFVFVLLTAVCMIAPIVSQTEDDFQVLQKPDGTVTITGYSGALAAITIPATIHNQPVNEIGSNSFAGSTTLRSVTLPASITVIGNSAFAGCSNLANVRFGQAVVSIGDRAFWNCALPAVDLPASLLVIGNSAFAGNRFTSVTIPDSVTRIGVDAFSANPSLGEFLVGSSVEEIFYNALGTDANPLSLIVIRRTGLNLGSIGLDPSFVNVYGTGGAGVYAKRGNVWLKETADPMRFALPNTTPQRMPERSAAIEKMPAPLPASAPPPSWSQTPVPPPPPSSAVQPVVNPAPRPSPSVRSASQLIGSVWTVYFPPNEGSFTGLNSVLAATNKKTLEDLATLLEENPSLNVRIIGYTNPMQPTRREEQTVLRPLSTQRAENVASVLDFYGISRQRMTVRGAGGDSPLASYASRGDWYRNRRVEITIVR
ncbi:MAG: leucine-rich repeat protein [Spirochaetaceae bacterium]|jgi:outer membrane protein OmpA-like peptidoglycan-associated protein|nr:leucine-rich repeat protein [Spirochaetaceae bacterium]